MFTDDKTGPLDQGDIIGKTAVKEIISWWPDDIGYPLIILTPQCDITQKKADHFKLAVMLPFKTHAIGVATKIAKGDEYKELINSKKKERKLFDVLSRTISNGTERYHFFPKNDIDTHTDFVVDFEIVISCPIEMFNSEHRALSLISPFKEEFIHRYCRYGMRIGTPDIPSEQKRKILSNVYAELEIPELMPK